MIPDGIHGKSGIYVISTNSTKTYVVAGLQKHQLLQWIIIGSRATLGPCTPQNGEMRIFS